MSNLVAILCSLSKFLWVQECNLYIITGTQHPALLPNSSSSSYILFVPFVIFPGALDKTDILRRDLSRRRR